MKHCSISAFLSFYMSLSLSLFLSCSLSHSLCCCFHCFRLWYGAYILKHSLDNSIQCPYQSSKRRDLTQGGAMFLPLPVRGFSERRNMEEAYLWYLPQMSGTEFMAGIANGKERKDQRLCVYLNLSNRNSVWIYSCHIFHGHCLFFFFFFPLSWCTRNYTAEMCTINITMWVNHNYIFNKMPHHSYSIFHHIWAYIFFIWLGLYDVCLIGLIVFPECGLCLKPVKINLKPIYSEAVYLWAVPDLERWAVKKDWAHTAKEHGLACRKRVVLTTKQMFNGRITGFTLHIFMYFSSTAILRSITQPSFSFLLSGL